MRYIYKHWRCDYARQDRLLQLLDSLLRKVPVMANGCSQAWPPSMFIWNLVHLIDRIFELLLWHCQNLTGPKPDPKPRGHRLSIQHRIPIRLGIHAGYVDVTTGIHTPARSAKIMSTLIAFFGDQFRILRKRTDCNGRATPFRSRLCNVVLLNSSVAHSRCLYIFSRPFFLI